MKSIISSALSRRQFLLRNAGGLTAALSAGALTELSAAAAAAPVRPMVELPEIKAATERRGGPLFAPLEPRDRVGFAIVGLGHLSLEQLLPAFGQCQKAKLVALVSRSPDKAKRIAQQHGLSPQSIYDYEHFDTIRDNPDIQVVYIVLPNSMHAEYTVRAAQAGKHVLCEKPMATSVADCERMITACEQAKRRLMIAYRMQYEPYNRLVQKMVRTEKFGKTKFIEGINAQNQGDPHQWRQNKILAGGGPLPDVGIYLQNTARFLLGEEPVEVFASLLQNKEDPRFKEVEESVAFQLRFPGGTLCSFSTGYSCHVSQRYRVHGETGWIDMDPAFPYEGLQLKTSHPEGAMESVDQIRLGLKHQFATELDHMADCVMLDRRPYTPGEEGLQDMKIIAALYQSAAERKPIELPHVAKQDAFRGPAPEAG